jgi:transposase
MVTPLFKTKNGSRLKHGNNHLRAILTECAWAAVKTNNTYFRAKFYKRNHPKSTVLHARGKAYWLSFFRLFMIDRK